MAEKKTVYLVVRDKFILGVLGDALMYGMMLGLWYINYKYLGNSWFIGLAIAFIIITSIVSILFGKYRHTFYNKEDAIKYINEQS